MTGQSGCGGVYSCALRSTTDLVTESQDTAVNNSTAAPEASDTAPVGASQEKRPSVDLSALERKTIRGGITRFHCRYFLKPRSNKQQQQQQQQHEVDEVAPEQHSNCGGSGGGGGGGGSDSKPKRVQR